MRFFRVPASLCLLAVVVGLSGRMAAQQPAVPVLPPEAVAVKPSPELAGIAHIALRVKDLEPAVAFYQKLGFVQAFSLSRNGAVYEAFIKINDRQFIELYPATAEQQPGFLHVCFEGRALQAAHDFYVAAGLKPTAVRTAGAGNLLFTMPGPQTPTGPQNMEYTQYMPGSLHSRDFGQHLGAERIGTEIRSVAIAVDEPATARAFYLDKAGFLPGLETVVRIPGTSHEFLELPPAASLGTRARFSVGTDDVQKAAAQLKLRSVPFRTTPEGLLLTDPDGNEVVVTKGR